MVDACRAALSLAGRGDIAAARGHARLASSRHAASDAARPRPPASDSPCCAVPERVHQWVGGTGDVYGGATAGGAATTWHGALFTFRPNSDYDPESDPDSAPGS